MNKGPDNKIKTNIDDADEIPDNLRHKLNNNNDLQGMCQKHQQQHPEDDLNELKIKNETSFREYQEIIKGAYKSFPETVEKIDKNEPNVALIKRLVSIFKIFYLS